jgi:NAD(P)-dependent dehydrogenase (short-subunit alcohol dehydrogenase family)
MAPMTGTVIKDFPLNMSSQMNIAEKTILVIGGTSGLGQAIALEAREKGAQKVTVVGRSFKDTESSNYAFVKADLSSMKEAKRIGETIPPADIVVLTAGIFSSPQRQETAEGLECDMATSYLSRFVILQALVPRLAPNSRVFIMGFPGSNSKPYNLDDLNSDKTKYDSMSTHLTTVMANEALVLDWAAQDPKHALFFGLNPGLIKTGIRANVYTSGVMRYVGPILEVLIGWFSLSATGYAKRMIPLLLASNLNDHSGTMFNPKAQAVKPSDIFVTNAGLAKKVMEDSAALLKEKQIP